MQKREVFAGKMFVAISATFGRQLLGIVAGVASVALIARFLGPEGNGIYALSILLPVFFANIGSFGLPAANAYFLARGEISLRLSFNVSLIFGIIVSVSGFAAIYLFLAVWGSELFPDVPKLALNLGLYAFPWILLQSLCAGLLQGIQDFRSYNFVLLVSPLLLLFLLLVFLGFFEAGVYGAIVAFGISNCLGLLIMVFAVMRKARLNSGAKQSINEYLKSALGYGIKAHVANVIQLLNYRADLFLVGFFLGPIEAGFYFIATQIAERLWVLSRAVSTVLFPRLSHMHADEVSRKWLTPVVSRWTLYLTMLGAIASLVVIKTFILVFFGAQYEPAVAPFVILLPGTIFGTILRTLANDLAARGRPELNLYVASKVLVINIILNLVFIPVLGIEGAAVATSISYCAGAVSHLTTYSRIAETRWWEPVFGLKADMALMKKKRYRD